MSSSFAAYASQFITRNANGHQSTSDEPMFFSFTTASDGESRAAGGNGTLSRDEFDLDDPHLRGSRFNGDDEEDEDPYLRLDGTGRQEQDKNQNQEDSPLSSPDAYSGGWLAHQPSPMRDDVGRRKYDDEEEEEDDDDGGGGGGHITTGYPNDDEGDGVARQHQAISLSTSLLPPPTNPDAFNLPDPRYAHLRGVGGRRKYNNSTWTALWLFSISVCYLSALVLLFAAPSNPNQKIPAPLPYPTHLHTIPLLILLSLLSAVAAYVHIALLRWFLRPVVWICALATPAMLLVGAVWAWAGSFVDEDEGDATGLRIFSLFPLLLSLYLFYRLYTLYTHLPSLLTQLTLTSRLLNLTTHILTQNPFLLLLSPCLLLIIALGSIPFGTVVYRLLLIGYTVKIKEGEGWEYHVKPWAHLCVFGAVGVWMWSWGVGRGVLRVVCAGVVGAWYFDWEPEGGLLEGDRDRDVERGAERDEADLDLDDLEPPPGLTSFARGYGYPNFPNMSLNTPAMRIHTLALHSSLHRATRDSLGSISLSSLILTSIRSLALLLFFIDNIPSYLTTLTRVLAMWSPPPLVNFTLRLVGTGVVQSIMLVVKRVLVWGGRMLVGYIGDKVEGISRLALVWVGMTGKEFWDSARRVGAIESEITRSKARSSTQSHPRPHANSNPKPTLPSAPTGPPPLSPLITHTPLTLVLPFALSTYLFVSHTLGAPHQALGAAVLAAGISAGTAVFCVGVVRDVGDAVWVCYLMGREGGGQEQEGGTEHEGRMKESKKRKLVREVFEISSSSTTTRRNGNGNGNGRAAQSQPHAGPSTSRLPPHMQTYQGSGTRKQQPPVPSSIQQALREPLLASPPDLGSNLGLPSSSGFHLGQSQAAQHQPTRQERKQKQARAETSFGAGYTYPAISKRPEYSAYPAYDLSDSEDEDVGRTPVLGTVPEEIDVRKSRMVERRKVTSTSKSKAQAREDEDEDEEDEVDPFAVDLVDRDEDEDGTGTSRKHVGLSGSGSGFGFGMGMGHVKSTSGSGSRTGLVGFGHSRVGSGSGSVVRAAEHRESGDANEDGEDFFPGSGLFGSQ